MPNDVRRFTDLSYTIYYNTTCGMLYVYVVPKHHAQEYASIEHTTLAMPLQL